MTSTPNVYGFECRVPRNRMAKNKPAFINDDLVAQGQDLQTRVRCYGLEQRVQWGYVDISISIIP